jgi:Tol biopolymer transport system component
MRLASFLLLGFLLANARLPLDVDGAEPPGTASAPSAATNLAGAGPSFAPVFSGDGNRIAFLSAANNLVTNDDRAPHLDVFVRDLAARATTLASVNLSGVGGGDDNLLAPVLSSNGRVVAFESAASNLASNDTNRVSDIFVRDLAAGTTLLASVNTNGASGNGASTNPHLSADGRWVVFESTASDLVFGDTKGVSDVFARDLQTGTTHLVSVSADGSRSGDLASHTPDVSADGRFVAFVSKATNLVTGATNRLGEVFVRDLVSGTTTWASAYKPTSVLAAAGGDYASSDPAMTPDGRFVAFKAGGVAVFRYDSQGIGESNIWRWQLTPVGSPGLSISDDGRHVLYESQTLNASGAATNSQVRRLDMEWRVVCGVSLVGEGSQNPQWITNYCWEARTVTTNYARAASMARDGQRVAYLASPNSIDLQTPAATDLLVTDFGAETNLLVSVRRDGSPAAGLDLIVPAISPDGNRVAFDTVDDGLVDSDFNAASDVCVRDLTFQTTELVSQRHAARPQGTGLGLATLGPNCLSADGRLVVFTALDSYPDHGDTNRWPDVFARDLLLLTNLPLSEMPLLTTNGASQLATNAFPGKVGAREPALSADGRYASFVRHSYGPSQWGDELVRVELGTRVSMTGASSSGPVLALGAPALDPTGRGVVFHSRSDASVLVPGMGDGNGGSDVFLRDFNTNVIELVSVNRLGTGTGNGVSTNLVMSPDGQRVVFQSRARDLTDDPVTGSYFHLYARDLAGRRTHLVSHRGGTPPVGGSWYAEISGGVTGAVFSANSRYIAFYGATNFTGYLHDLLHYTTNLVTENPEVVFTNDLWVTNIVFITNAVPLPPRIVCTNCLNPSLSGDGHWVAYQTRTNATDVADIYVTEVETGATSLISVNRAGTSGGNGHSAMPLLSWNVRYVVFTSLASDLVDNDRNHAWDVFVRDRWANTTLLVSVNAAGTGSANRSCSKAVLGPDGRTVVFQTFANDIVTDDYNLTRDIFVLRLAASDSDADGLDDDWEMTYFGDLSHDGKADTDSDGLTDRQEFFAGTNPINDTSVLRVLTLTAVSDGTTTVLWSSVPGRTYRLQFKGGVGDPSWNDVPGDVVTVGMTASKLVPAGPSSAQRFYRVLLVQ